MMSRVMILSMLAMAASASLTEKCGDGPCNGESAGGVSLLQTPQKKELSKALLQENTEDSLDQEQGLEEDDAHAGSMEEEDDQQDLEEDEVEEAEGARSEGDEME